jgi:hypothetical protein
VKNFRACKDRKKEENSGAHEVANLKAKLGKQARKQTGGGGKEADWGSRLGSRLGEQARKQAGGAG